ncbi:MAG: RNA methyltransferase, partial [Candidatus Competibacteraceae bacterium]|nr:RNA methyltransferase [Candidatus Competibacteraceae bacterium]
SYVPVVTTANLARAVEELKRREFWVWAADAGGSDCRDAALAGRTALVLGSEGAGVSRLLRDRCDGAVRIPTRGHVDSFNVSVACGILLYEVRRQQGLPEREKT